MANAKDIAATNPEASILLVGDSGTHKTYFAGTVPGVYIFDFDAGMAINRGKDVEYDTFKEMPYGQNKIPESFKRRGYFQWGTGWDAFIKRLNEIGTLMDQGDWNGRPIAIDSLTTLMTMAMNYVLRQNNKKPSDAKSFNDWGQQIGLVETVMDQLTGWPVMLICTAHIHRDTNPNMETVEMLPLLTGKFAGRIGIYFDEVWYTRTDGKTGERPKFVLQTTSTGMIKQAKTRYGVPVGVEADWSQVARYFTQPPR